MSNYAPRTVRIFLSSTFRDFGEELDNLLVRRVFPTLRARLRERFVELFDVDLRWSITPEDADLECTFGPHQRPCAMSADSMSKWSEI